MSTERIIELGESILGCLRMHQIAPPCQEQVTQILESYIRTLTPVATPPTLVTPATITEIRISKFKQIKGEDIPWRQGNIYAFSAESELGREYRWISIRYSAPGLSDDFLLVSPKGVTAGQIRSSILTLGVPTFTQFNDLGTVLNPATIDIRPVTGPYRCRIPMAYLSSTPIANGCPMPIALGIIKP